MRLLSKKKSVGISPDICEKYRNYLFNVAFHITKDKSYAEDVVQETICKIIKTAPKLSGQTEEDVKKYLTKAVTNNALTYMSKTVREIPTENLFDDVAFDVVLEKVLLAETSEQMNVALAKLTPKQRIVLILMFYENWDSEQIAEYMGITADGVRMLKKRGLDSMREILTKDGWEK